MTDEINYDYLYDELEDIATYKNTSWDEEEFLKDIEDLKGAYKKYKLKVPAELNLVRKTSDFRSNMQKFASYKERRERLREIIYPLIDFQNNTEDSIVLDNQISVKELNEYFKKNNFTLNTSYGDISNISISSSKSGGNGIVYFGDFNKNRVAIKFMLKADKQKKHRFLLEFINVIMKMENYEGIVRQYFYEEIIINNSRVPFIVMKEYSNRLEYVDNVSNDGLISYFSQIMNALKKIHECGIVHRDLKPANILIDENGRLNISDFGIAYYNSNYFDNTGHTKSADRLANFEFSAPEQKDSNYNVCPAVDIYALGQIIYWLVYNKTSKGSHRKSITDKYPGKRMEILDNIVDRCICNEQKDRFQSIDEIYDYIKSLDKEVVEPNTNISSELSSDEIKNKLEDIILNITKYEAYDEYGMPYYEKTFATYEDFTKNEIIDFINDIPVKEKELIFYDKVNFTYFFNKHIRNINKIDKKYFIELYKLYDSLKGNSNLISSFITYVLNSFNDNYDLPF